MFALLRTKLVVICVSIVIVAMAASAASSYVFTRSRMLEALEGQTLQLARSQAGQFGEWVQSKRQIIASLKQAADESDPLPYVRMTIAAGKFDSAFLGYPDKRMITPDKHDSDYDPTTKPWYVKAAVLGGPALTQPYISSISGKLIVTFSDPVGEKDSIKAIAAGNIDIDTIIKGVAEMKPTPSSYAFLVDSSGMIIAHRDAKLTTKTIADVDAALTLQKLQQIESSRHPADARVAGRDALLAVEKMEGCDWLLAFAAFILTGGIFAALKRLTLVRDALDDIASGEGDLTHRLDAGGAATNWRRSPPPSTVSSTRSNRS